MKWFVNCVSLADAKSLYKELAKRYHPDVAGAEHTSTMQEINAEFEDFCCNIRLCSGKTADVPMDFINIVDKLIGCDGLVIELVGVWIWVTGVTFPYKDVLRSLGFRWAPKKKAWYWHDGDTTIGYHHGKPLDKIKEKYGCQTFSTKAHAKLT